MSEKKHSFGIHSINFHLWLYFTLFTIAIVALISVAMYFVITNYYGDMKEKDTELISAEIKSSYRNQDSAREMYKDLSTIASSNDVNIFIRRAKSGSLQTLTFSGMNPMYGRLLDYNSIIDRLASKLSVNSRIKDNSFPKISNSSESSSSSSSSSSDSSEDSDDSDTTEGPSISGFNNRSAKLTISVGSNMSVLAYACVITSSDDLKSGYTTTMYIFTPLYPATSTLRILNRVLVIALFVAALLALIIAMVIANRISRPINKITNSAKKLSDGDYNVKFEGKPYAETVELAKTLTVAENEMRKTDEYHKDLIANVSHDLRTPLTMIKSYAEMIRDLSGDDPAKRNRHLGVIIEESDRLNNMVSDLLNLSRLQSHKIELEKKDFDLNDAVDTMLATYNLMEESEGYTIVFNKCKPPCVINADPTRIDQVMANLLSNAIKYCGEDKKIIIETKKENNYVTFSVTDHGKGIKPEELPHVWDRYYKSSTNHVRETKGSGIGLSIVKELLKLHDAEYGVESEVGKGSTFWFRLPQVSNKTSLLSR